MSPDDVQIQALYRHTHTHTHTSALARVQNRCDDQPLWTAFSRPQYRCYLMEVHRLPEARGGAVGCGTASQARRSLQFFTDLIHSAAMWPCSRLSLWQEWVPGYLWCVGWPCHLHVHTVWISREPQAPEILTACPSLYRDIFTFI